jgi:hypothetical protein
MIAMDFLRGVFFNDVQQRDGRSQCARERFGWIEGGLG